MEKDYHELLSDDMFRSSQTSPLPVQAEWKQDGQAEIYYAVYNYIDYQGTQHPPVPCLPSGITVLSGPGRLSDRYQQNKIDNKLQVFTVLSSRHDPGTEITGGRDSSEVQHFQSVRERDEARVWRSLSESSWSLSMVCCSGESISSVRASDVSPGQDQSAGQVFPRWRGQGSL